MTNTDCNVSVDVSPIAVLRRATSVMTNTDGNNLRQTRQMEGEPMPDTTSTSTADKSADDKSAADSSADSPTPDASLAAPTIEDYYTEEQPQ